MGDQKQNRRSFLRSSVGIAAGGVLGPHAPGADKAGIRGPSSKNDRPQVGAIGVGWTPERTTRGTRIAGHARRFADLVAVCDVDRTAAEHARETLTGGKAKIYENYSGGKMTDWGAHHVDIAQWVIGMENSGPTSIEGTGTIPRVENGFNTATTFRISCRYANGVELVIRHDGDRN